jgi:hypothetical protein
VCAQALARLHDGRREDETNAEDKECRDENRSEVAFTDDIVLERLCTEAWGNLVSG